MDNSIIINGFLRSSPGTSFIAIAFYSLSYMYLADILADLVFRSLHVDAGLVSV